MPEPTLHSLAAPRVRVRDADGHLSVLVLDLFAIFFAHALCYRLYSGEWFGHDTVGAGIAVVFYTLIASARGLHRGFRTEPLSESFQRVWVCWAYVIPLLLAAGFFSKTLESYSRVVGLAWFVVAPLFVTLARLGQRASQRTRVLGYQPRRAAVFGASDLGIELVTNMLGASGFGMGFAGIYDDRHISRLCQSTSTNVNTVGDLDRLIEAARAGLVDVIYIALPLRAERRINTIIRRLQDTTASVYVACDFSAICAQGIWRQVGEVPVMQVTASSIEPSTKYELQKRVEDVLLGGLLIVVLAVPMLCIALLVKLSSRGPTFIRKRRFGLHGEEVRLLAFRTRKVTPDPAVPEREPPLTPCGQWLISTGLDELPALIQVLLGNLSIVGPRPHTDADASEYRALVEAHGFTRKVKPGITCLAQVERWRRGGEPEGLSQRVEYDLAYARDWALSRDLDILFRTAQKLVKSRRPEPTRPREESQN
ncbi:MAG: sugar transferase [Polyangiales bacterium]